MQSKSTKLKIGYRCSNCGQESSKWIGRCPACEEWNSFIEEQTVPNAHRANNIALTPLVALNEIDTTQQHRMKSQIKEWDNVLGGGILPGSFLILTGDPGIGKSTLLLQVAHHLAQSYNVLYFSSEESLQQVKSRALRLAVKADRLRFSDQPHLERIIATAQHYKPDLIILDSIQNCHLSLNSTAIPGTIAQLREAGFLLMRLAKEHNIAVLITGHITKDGQMAGPKILEHMVDGVFYLQGEDRWQTRLLRSVKNRFGTINEVGFFEMQEHGMVELANINQHLLSDSAQAPGSALVCCMEGSRPLLLELQALCVQSKFGLAQRVVTGIDPKRILLIAAIIEKYLHIKLSQHDIFFKVSGGFKIKESGADLGIALALLSSYFQIPLPPQSVAIGEMSLTGLIKPINQIDQCVKEIEKFGFAKIFISHTQQVSTSCAHASFKNIYELLTLFPQGG